MEYIFLLVLELESKYEKVLHKKITACRFEMTNEWVNNDRMFSFRWSISLKSSANCWFLVPGALHADCVLEDWGLKTSTLPLLETPALIILKGKHQCLCEVSFEYTTSICPCFHFPFVCACACFLFIFQSEEAWVFLSDFICTLGSRERLCKKNFNLLFFFFFSLL